MEVRLKLIEVGSGEFEGPSLTFSAQGGGYLRIPVDKETARRFGSHIYREFDVMVGAPVVEEPSDAG